MLSLLHQRHRCGVPLLQLHVQHLTAGGFRVGRQPRQCSSAAMLPGESSQGLQGPPLPPGQGDGQGGNFASPRAASSLACSTSDDEGVGLKGGQHLVQLSSSRGPRLRPNYFLALQLSQSEKTVSAIETVQKSLVGSVPQLRSALVESATAHLTLMVMHLEKEKRLDRATDTALDVDHEACHEDVSKPEASSTQQEPGATSAQLPEEKRQDGLGESSTITVARAEEVLAAAGAVLEAQGLRKPVEVVMRGLGNFNNRVLFLDTERGPQRDIVAQLAEGLQCHFESSGIPSLGRDFSPHVTIAKMNKAGNKGKGWKRWRKRGRVTEDDSENLSGHDFQLEADDGAVAQGSGAVSMSSENGKREKRRERKYGGRLYKIPEDAYSQHLHIDGGVVTAEEVQLCEMQNRKSGHYYNVVSSLSLCQ